jgi:hypothetical protein
MANPQPPVSKPTIVKAAAPYPNAAAPVVIATAPVSDPVYDAPAVDSSEYSDESLAKAPEPEFDGAEQHQALLNDVTATPTIAGSIATLLNGLAERLSAAIHSHPHDGGRALSELQFTLATKSPAIAAAVSANTPVVGPINPVSLAVPAHLAGQPVAAASGATPGAAAAGASAAHGSTEPTGFPTSNTGAPTPATTPGT